MEKYDPKKIEPKWQKYWEQHPELCAAADDSKKEKKYILDMFPYPSGAGLHIGHVESYTATDIVSRYWRMNKKNVLHPQGWDAFGLPAENYAIKTGVHPSETTVKAIKTFTKQINSLGFSYDWSREINTSDPNYYKWTQWLFLLFYKNGLAYKKLGKVNWCPSCQTVLANEQVVDGKCERCGTEVVQKDLEQWFFKITDFIEQNKKTPGLIDGLEKLDWPDSTKAAQKNWIGKSEGTEFDFSLKDSELKIKVYTTRIDTVFGVTYVVVGPEHPILEKLKAPASTRKTTSSSTRGGQILNLKEVEDYKIQSQNKTDLERMEAKIKTGVEVKGVKVINPFNNEEVPLFVADYVLSQYGTGAVMAVPAHDERDFEFAKKYDLPINDVVMPIFGEPHEGAIKRHTISPVIQRKSDGKFLFLKLKGAHAGVVTTIIGGIEGREKIEDAAIRETLEETGFQTKFIKKLGGTLESHFYAAHKKEWRMRIDQPVVLELVDEKSGTISEEEKALHDVIWLTKEEAMKQLDYESDILRMHRFFGTDTAYVNDGSLIQSENYNGLSSENAREKMTVWLEKEGIGKRKINYRLRDWLVSRQRYWGAPIPIIYCEKCGAVPVPEKDLPVELPTDVDFKPTGESPLIHSKTFHDVKCPNCGEKARRESDTMDTFVCSSWYYFRYADPKNEKEFASKEQIEKWLPVDVYVGGAEHSVLHLLYARFFTKALHNLGYVDFDEPFVKLRHQGTILAEDGRKMSKSLGNVVNPDDIVKEYGADALRMFEMFMGPIEAMKPWNTKGISGVYKFLDKTYGYIDALRKFFGDEDINKWVSGEVEWGTLPRIKTALNKTIEKVTRDIEEFKFNTAISQLMVMRNAFYAELGDKASVVSKSDFETFIILIAPFAPHLAEEIWHEQLKHEDSIFLQPWPQHDEALLKDDEIEMVVQVNGRVRERLMVAPDVTEDEVKETALESVKVKVFTDGKEIKKIIFVPEKLLNIVVECEEKK